MATTTKARLDVSGDQLRLARHALRWTQDELAERSGISRVTIAGLEGDRIPDPKRATLMAIVRVLEKAGVEFTEHGVEINPRGE